MATGINRRLSIVQRALDDYEKFRAFNPLGILDYTCRFMQNHFKRVPGCAKLFSSIQRLITIFQQYLDSAFDRAHGTNTSGVIPIKDLTIEGKNTALGIWYEPMTEKIFRQIMNNLIIDFDKFTFIDFGSGKGRVLLMASDYNFKKIIGVEFARELHRIATDNVAHYRQSVKPLSIFKTICQDAVTFPIPNEPLVLFFYSPFKGKVMEHVLTNIRTSFNLNPRKILLLFYGRNRKSVELLKVMNFPWRELKITSDWSQLKNYRGFLLTSP